MPLPYCQDSWLIGIEQASTLGMDQPTVTETTLRKHWLPDALWDCRVLILCLSPRVSAPSSLIQHSVQLPFHRRGNLGTENRGHLPRSVCKMVAGPGSEARSVPLPSHSYLEDSFPHPGEGTGSREEGGGGLGIQIGRTWGGGEREW